MSIKFYKVGGCVRDVMMGIKPKDIDYAVEAESYEAMRDYIAQHGKIYQERPQFFTVRARINDEDCDYVLCRKEGAYSDGRHPDSVEAGTIYDDLARRDFTCNAMAMDENYVILDPYNGYSDISRKTLRCVGDPYVRFNEDYLRMIRAIRFAVTKDFQIHPSVLICLNDKELVEKIKTIPVERIREELVKAFAHDTNRTLDLLERFWYLRQAIFERNLTLVPTIYEL